MIKGEKIVYNDSGRWLNELVLKYIKTRKKISLSVEGRTREI